jgi:lysophospholipase L1-like esterase
MKRKVFVLAALTVGVFIVLSGAVVFAEDIPKSRQLAPKRLSSTGDSITEAIDAELPFANHWASWVNGYHGFWEWLFGLTDVYSHNQRITRNFGWWGRKNFMEAESGADMFDFPYQAAQSAGHSATYVTVLMGHNDVCQSHVWDIPTDEEFEGEFRKGLDNLKSGLPDGATIYVIGMVDITRLWEIARHKKALGIVDCQILWATSLFDLFPCATVLSPLADREYALGRIEGFNKILQDVTKEYNEDDSRHHYVYTNAVFTEPFVESDVSDIDCFHPSARGQKTLSEITWEAGPFSAHRR